jgi:hypothetical protein
MAVDEARPDDEQGHLALVRRPAGAKRRQAMVLQACASGDGSFGVKLADAIIVDADDRSAECAADGSKIRTRGPLSSGLAVTALQAKSSSSRKPGSDVSLLMQRRGPLLTRLESPGDRSFRPRGGFLRQPGAVNC